MGTGFVAKLIGEALFQTLLISAPMLGLSLIVGAITNIVKNIARAIII